MNALMNLPSTCGAIASTSTPASLRKCGHLRCCRCASAHSTSVKPAASAWRDTRALQARRRCSRPRAACSRGPLRHLAANHDIGDGKSASGLEHAKRLAQYPALVCRKIDHAVRDDDIHRVVWQRNVLDFAFEEFDVRGRPPVSDSRGPVPASRRSCPGRRLCRLVPPAALRAARRCRRLIPDRAPSRPRFNSIARSDSRIPATRARPSPESALSLRRCRDWW